MPRYATRYFVGIDEAGRGPLAGPVTVAGVMISERVALKIFSGIRDSKKLSAKQRELWYRLIIADPRIEWAVASIWPKVIDRINIAQAANRGARRVFLNLCAELSSVQRLAQKITAPLTFLDAGLVLPSHILHEVIVKGDEKIPAIAAASIIAKVTRDRIMRRLHKKYPQYRFDLHKGYGTKLHRELIQKFGLAPVHRITFAKKFFF